MLAVAVESVITESSLISYTMLNVCGVSVLRSVAVTTPLHTSKQLLALTLRFPATASGKICTEQSVSIGSE